MNLLYCWLGLFVHVNLIVRYGCEPIVPYFVQSLWCVSNHRNERINFLISIQYLWMVHVQKKNSACGGRNPWALYKRRPHTQAEKTPEPLPHPYTGAPLPLWVRAGTFLSCFGMAVGEGIFLTLAWNSLPPGVEPRTWGVLLRPPNQSG